MESLYILVVKCCEGLEQEKVVDELRCIRRIVGMHEFRSGTAGHFFHRKETVI